MCIWSACCRVTDLLHCITPFSGTRVPPLWLTYTPLNHVRVPFTLTFINVFRIWSLPEPWHMSGDIRRAKLYVPARLPGEQVPNKPRWLPWGWLWPKWYVTCTGIKMLSSGTYSLVCHSQFKTDMDLNHHFSVGSSKMFSFITTKYCC